MIGKLAFGLKHALVRAEARGPGTFRVSPGRGVGDMKNRYLVLAISILVVAGCGMAKAQQEPAQQEPEPGAGRVSLIHGDVSTQRAGSDDWVAATVNATVVRGDSVSTGERSRTELELEYANIL